MKSAVLVASLLVAAGLPAIAVAQERDPGCAVDSPAPSVSEDLTDPTNWRDRVAAARARVELWRLCSAARARTDGPPPPPGPMDRLLGDETLRPGDIVSTQSGLRVFRGAIGPTNRLEDFPTVSGK